LSRSTLLWPETLDEILVAERGMESAPAHKPGRLFRSFDFVALANAQILEAPSESADRGKVQGSPSRPIGLSGSRRPKKDRLALAFENGLNPAGDAV
jgi:hypothetical protein